MQEIDTIHRAFTNLGKQGENLRERYQSLHEDHQVGPDFQVQDQALWNVQCELQFESLDVRIGTQASDNCPHILAKTGVFGIMVHDRFLVS